MHAQIRQAIVDRIKAAHPSLSVFNARVSPIALSELPAANVHIRGGNAEKTPDELNNRITDRVSVYLTFAGDDNPDAGFVAVDSLQEVADEWAVNIRNLFNYSRENLGKLVYRLDYTGFSVSYNRETEQVSCTVELTYDASYPESLAL